MVDFIKMKKDFDRLLRSANQLQALIEVIREDASRGMSLKKMDPIKHYDLVDEEFGSTIVQCPVHGEISLGYCAEERKKGFSTSRADIWLACRDCAERR